MNLFSNALKFTQKGKVDINVKYVEKQIDLNPKTADEF